MNANWYKAGIIYLEQSKKVRFPTTCLSLSEHKTPFRRKKYTLNDLCCGTYCEHTDSMSRASQLNFMATKNDNKVSYRHEAWILPFSLVLHQFKFLPPTLPRAAQNIQNHSLHNDEWVSIFSLPAIFLQLSCMGLSWGPSKNCTVLGWLTQQSSATNSK